MKKSELKNLIKEALRENKQEVENLYYIEKKDIGNNKIIYAICTSDGHFKSLEIYNKNQIIDDKEENNDGVFVLYFKNKNNF